MLDELAAGTAGGMTGLSYAGALAATLRVSDVSGNARARAVFLPWLPLVSFEAQGKIGLAIRKQSSPQTGV